MDNAPVIESFWETLKEDCDWSTLERKVLHFFFTQYLG